MKPIVCRLYQQKFNDRPKV